jgi:SAM-dependent methyltransferase
VTVLQIFSKFRSGFSRRFLPVRWGTLRRLTPVSSVFGFDRGEPIDRHYIAAFLQKNCGDIRGRVLEIGDATYTRQYGGGKVVKSDVLHVTAGQPEATLVGDLATGYGIPPDCFDCIILTQTLPFIYEVKEALGHACRALKPGGVLLATFPGISQISRFDMDRWGDFWRFTTASALRLFGELFGEENVEVQSHGNVLAACAFLHGLAGHELSREELDHNDPDYQLLITVRAVKRAGG